MLPLFALKYFIFVGLYPKRMNKVRYEQLHAHKTEHVIPTEIFTHTHRYRRVGVEINVIACNVANRAIEIPVCTN